jgi:hypothetical protein
MSLYNNNNDDLQAPIGCFTIIDKYFAHNLGFLYNVQMTVELCKNFCAIKKYAWIKKGSFKFNYFIQKKIDF